MKVSIIWRNWISSAKQPSATRDSLTWRGLQGSKRLGLCGTKLTGTGFLHLSRLNNLQLLHLEASEVGDSAVEDLARMKGLRAVYFFRTRVTAVGLTKLHQAAPNLEFWHNVPAEQFSKIAPAQGEPMTGGMERPGARVALPPGQEEVCFERVMLGQEWPSAIAGSSPGGLRSQTWLLVSVLQVV